MSAGVALVTGGARRIGRAIVMQLAEAGFAIALHYGQSRDEAEEAVAAIVAAGGRAHAVPTDLMWLDAGALIGAAGQALGPVTLLVNNASLFQRDDVATLDAASFERNLQVNMKAPVLLAQAFAAALPAGEHGAIVNLIDQRVLHPGADFLSYTIAKSALWTATQMLAQALAPRIRVNAIGPGPVLPNTHEGADGFAGEVARVPLKQPVAPEDIAEAVLYLARARSVTGQMLAVDAGQHLV
jgi:NAD(P)-dependent dehydrogenase (short-subunit alcohol dehydrogenase family)